MEGDTHRGQHLFLRPFYAGALLGLAFLAACAPIRRIFGAREVALPMREGFVTADDGAQLFYRVVGSGRDTVIALHGGPGLHMGTLVSFDALAAGGAVIFYDQRGGGRSTVPVDSTQVTVTRHVADLEAVRRHFRLERASIVGHSWGALLGAWYAGDHPSRIRHLVLVAPTPPRFEPYIREFLTGFPRLLGENVARYAQLNAAWDTTTSPVELCREFVPISVRLTTRDPAVVDTLTHAVCSGVHPESLRRGWTTTPRWTLMSLGPFDLRARAANVRAPVLVIHGERDAFPVAASREWAAAFPRGRFELLPGIGHFPFAEDPVRFAALVREFLARE